MSSRNPVKQILLTVPKRVLPPRKSEKTREAILDSALEFLWTRPFRDLTVGELMSGTASSRSAFYQYFSDLHDLMETLLQGMKDDIFGVADTWLSGDGDPIPLLVETMSGLVRVCYRRGPILRAVADAASSDERLERTWAEFLEAFDNAVSERIKQHQAAGFISEFDARPVAVALNRMDASLLIHAFGRRPRGKPDTVRDSIVRIWISTLYGADALTKLTTSRPCQ